MDIFSKIESVTNDYCLKNGIDPVYKQDFGRVFNVKLTCNDNNINIDVRANTSCDAMMEIIKLIPLNGDCRLFKAIVQPVALT